MLYAGLSAGGVTAIVGVIGATVAIATLVKAVLEYSQQGRQRRADHFFELRRRLKDNDDFALVAELIDQTYAEEPLANEAREQLRELPFRVKRDYLGLFEEIAMAMNTGLIKPAVAHYMFGYYALLCWESDDFWFDVNRLSHYWSLSRISANRWRASKPGSPLTAEIFTSRASGRPLKGRGSSAWEAGLRRRWDRDGT